LSPIDDNRPLSVEMKVDSNTPLSASQGIGAAGAGVAGAAAAMAGVADISGRRPVR
jgi:hypothetical protein